MALADCPNVSTVLTVRRTAADVPWREGRDVWYHELVDDQPTACEPVAMAAEDPLFILYTSGSTGKPKGVQHSTGGYLLQAAITHKYVFDYTMATSTGVRRTSAGLPATPTSSTGLSPTAPPR